MKSLVHIKHSVNGNCQLSEGDEIEAGIKELARGFISHYADILLVLPTHTRSIGTGTVLQDEVFYHMGWHRLRNQIKM